MFTTVLATRKIRVGLVVLASLYSIVTFGQPVTDEKNCKNLFKGSQSLISTVSKITLPTQPEELDEYLIHNGENPLPLPLIPIEALAAIKTVSIEGNENEGGSIALLDGEKVFIKLVKRQYLTEPYWQIFLNRIGLGPQFFGVWRMSSFGREYYGLTSKFVDGINIKTILTDPDRIPPGFTLTKRVIEKMRSQVRQLEQAGVYTVDLQFLVTADEATLIDLYDYLPSTKASPYDLRKHSLRTQLEYLIGLWRSNGRLEP